MTEKTVQWEGVVVRFEDQYQLDSWLDTQDEDYIKEVKYYCHECFSKVSLANKKKVSLANRKKTKKYLRHYSRAVWDSYGYPIPMYTEFCSHCNNILDIQSEYCCISHQTKLSFSSGEKVLKIMAQQITEEQILCPYLVLQAVVFTNITRTDAKNIIELGEYHISRFEATPSGIMLLSLEE